MTKISVDKAFLKAKSHLRKGEIEQARLLYQGVLKTFPNNKRAKLEITQLNQNNITAPPESTINHLMALYQKGQLAETIEQARQLTQEFPHALMIWNILGAAASQIGKTTLAESALRQAMAIDSNNFDALNNLANLLSSQRKFDEAIPVYRQAICLKPDYAQAYNNLAVALSNQDRYDEALTAYKEMIILTPDDAEAYNNLAVTLNNQGKLDEAILAYRQAICLKPDFAAAYNNLAVALNNQGKLDEAIPAYRQAICLKPDYAEANNNLAVALNSQGKYDEAIAACQQALSLTPNFSEPYINLAVSFNGQDKFDEAIVASQQALSLKPDSTAGYNNMAVTLIGQGKFDEAIGACEQALTLMPDYADPYNNMAIALKSQGKYEEAITAYKKVLALKPDCAKTYFNMANAFNHQGKLDKALTAYKEALTLKPDYDDAKTNLSHLILKKGELQKGFELMEFRMQEQEPKATAPRENLIWHPEQGLQGKHFVVYDEQGLGDIMQFCRYLPLLEQRGANVSFKVIPKLHTLLSTLESQITMIEALPAEEEVDFEAPLLSLPHLFGTTLESVPAPTPYLYADHARIQTWSKVLSKQTFKIGICWQGSTNNSNDKNGIGRTFPLSLFTGIAQISGVELINLHKGVGERQLANIDFPVTTLGSNFDAGSDAFVDTAAVMTLCDLIITSDTSIAHLAGAMGCQTWVALQYAPDWRWMLNRTDSPWYPTMTLYRQRHPNDWHGVFATIEHDVHGQLNQKNPFYN